MIQVKNNVYWTGIKDWELRKFHGHELSTHRGSTYNSYLIKDEKTVLVDTVWNPYKEEFVENLEREVGLENIDMIIINHCEPDHSGSLGYLMEKIPNTPIYCSKKGEESIKGYFHKDWNINVVKTGDTIKIGENELVFVEMTMMHWPDSMLTYVKGANVVLSNDAFGQHYSAPALFNDQVDECELYQEAIKYFANILNPFKPLIKKKIEEIKALNLDIDVIAPSHGVIWRDNPMQIVEKYYEWSQNSYSEDYVVIIYDTMYDATKNLALSIAEGLRSKDIKYKVFNSSITDKSDLITELFKAKGIILGSCTVNNGSLSSISMILEEMKLLKFKNKPAAGFGSYGWSGEAPGHITEGLKKIGLKVDLEPVKFKYQPRKEDFEECIAFGEKFANNL
ncbi:MBL fold metallo-hydrolase [Herbivorax sp. ANBcel31]|uniref:MBL fold metallo-hydrolase n=1 Tax=Herbivorax sp. ANBcel31 TaxID=3069754 RepID=UPI0027B77DF8|nr:MBL fold metallo-hydrolase [Herbivorax sp. ANBcel31]MDQ2086209.1 MBL fold metallo-hydrolase [Herbivorax sp. ANBcel31]